MSSNDKKEPKLLIEAKKYGQGTETQVISFRLPKDLLSEIDRISAVTGRTRNEVLLMCTEFAVDHLEILPPENK